MLFHIYGANAGYQLLGWLLVFLGLIALNEIGRRTKLGGIGVFFVLPAILTVYFAAVLIGAASGAEWALNNPTYVYMNGWFHYAKLYAATIGCIGFIMIKYEWGIGAKEWFKPWPFLIVAINILIAVGSDFESAIKGGMTGGWWYSVENVWLYGGWWNWLNGIAGLLNILCMTGWWGIYHTKKRDDMLWPDMTWKFILAYDIWNFTYTYLNLPTHTWYCGVALLLAPTFAAMFWNKGGWIQNRAFTLSVWCMFAQVVPQFQISAPFSVLPVIYSSEYTAATELMNAAVEPAIGSPVAQGIMSILALVVNVVVLADIIKRSKKLGINPYKQEVWKGDADFEEAMARADV